jgi:hypothetical protein
MLRYLGYVSFRVYRYGPVTKSNSKTFLWVSFREDRAAAVACVGEPEVGDLFPGLV